MSRKLQKLVRRVEDLDRQRKKRLEEIATESAQHAAANPLSDEQIERVCAAATTGRPAYCCDDRERISEITSDPYWQQRIHAAFYEGASCRTSTKTDKYVRWRLLPTATWSPYHDFKSGYAPRFPTASKSGRRHGAKP